MVSYNVFLQALGRGQLWREAQLCFVNLQANKDGQGVQPNLRSFNTMLGVYEKASVWRQASALMASSTSIRPDKVTYHTLISTFGKGHQSLKAMQALESMRHSSLRPGLPGYNAAIRALAIEDNFEDFVGQRWGEALKLYRRMEEDSLRPDLGTYNGLVSVYGMAGKWSWALQVLEDVAQARLTPDEVTWSSVVDACAESSRWQAATSCFFARRSAPNVVTSSALIKAYERASQWQLALLFLQKMRRESKLPRPNQISWSSVMSASTQGFAWQHALLLLKMAQRDGIELKASMCNAAMSACAASKEWRQAMALLSECEPDLVTYNAFLAACEASQWERALTVMNLLKKQPNFLPDLISFNSLLATFEKAIKWELALSVLLEMCGGEVQADEISQNVVISACQQASRWQVAADMFFSQSLVRSQGDPLKLRLCGAGQRRCTSTTSSAGGFKGSGAEDWPMDGRYAAAGPGPFSLDQCSRWYVTLSQLLAPSCRSDFCTTGIQSTDDGLGDWHRTQNRWLSGLGHGLLCRRLGGSGLQMWQ